MSRIDAAIPWTTVLSVRAWASFGLLATCSFFFIFTYNSGYGYDALEYLVIGRSMAEGVPFYTYQPSKSPGIYYLVAWLHEAGIEFDHASLSAFITTLYAGAIVATFAVARRWFTMRAAYVIALLTALAAPFMEKKALESCVASPETRTRLEEDIAYASRFASDGTPIVAVNGRKGVSFAPFLYALILTGGVPEHPAFANLPTPNPNAHLH